jgi:hypothetical protein
MVIVLEAQLAVTPAGKPVGTPIPVAPDVAIVIAGLMAVFTQRVGDDEGGPAVLIEITVIVPVALMVPQPPVRGIL